MCIHLPWSLSRVEFLALVIGGGTCKKEIGRGKGAEYDGHPFTIGNGHLYFRLTKFERFW